MSLALIALAAPRAAAISNTPDPELTPGATRPTVTQATIHSTICRDDYSRTLRTLPVKAKAKVYEQYDVAMDDRGDPYIIDHLVPLELGGSNTIRNLWPQLSAMRTRKTRSRTCSTNSSAMGPQRSALRNWQSGLIGDRL